MISCPWQKSFHTWKRKFSMQNYFTVHIIVLRMMGMWPIEYENYLPVNLHFLSKYLNILYFAFNFFSEFFIVICLIVTLFVHATNLDEFSNFFITALVYFFLLLIRVYFIWKHKEINILLQYFNRNARSRSALGEFQSVRNCLAISFILQFLFRFNVHYHRAGLQIQRIPVYLLDWILFGGHYTLGATSINSAGTDLAIWVLVSIRCISENNKR